MGEAKRRKGNQGHLKVVADNTETMGPRGAERELKSKTAASTASREADLKYARAFWLNDNPSPSEVAYACARRDGQAQRGAALGASPRNEWAMAPAWVARFRSDGHATLEICLSQWGFTNTVEEFNEELEESIPLPQTDARALLQDLRFIARAMTDKNLSDTIAGMRAELAVFEAEKRLRQEDVATHYKDQHRVLVDLEDRLAPGDVITSKAGAEMVFGYFGQPWDMTERDALYHGRPDLAGRTVRYAYGKPIGGVVEHDLDAKPKKRKTSAKSKAGKAKKAQPALPLHVPSVGFQTTLPMQV